MYKLSWKIEIGNYRLALLDSVQVKKSVETLCDTAVITLPGSVFNKTIDIESKIKEGDKVLIQLGYDDNLQTEFTGYLESIATDNGSLQLNCEDSIYLFRKALKDRELKNITLQKLLQVTVDEINAQNKQNGTPTNYTIKCDYEFTWDKFVFFKASGWDVLKKVQDETKANIYFTGEILHIHPQYSEIANEKPVVFDFYRNIEKSDLKYVLLKNKKIEVVVEARLPDGKTRKFTYGTTGGIKENVNAGTADEKSMKNLALQRYNLFAYDGYEGTFTGWLLPFCEPTYKVKICDHEYPNKEGIYYVIATETKMSSNGGERVVTVGKKVG